MDSVTEQNLADNVTRHRADRITVVLSQVRREVARQLGRVGHAGRWLTLAVVLLSLAA